ncbi:pumilio-family rna binding repeat protein [Colletotrichum karsti]|uniref:Pumilio-family rna binding repeat protein n=1 Tax=Colletotrichum karsti TaxID=1095194 RepID=A0A9P6IFH4_9PEZI|nr:pumilio-family rna binding repeat protein [Colletotrichum karsti]KAF9877720.1 pumilio-family rna binding repeat protein [Colletotrichum karsti]
MSTPPSTGATPKRDSSTITMPVFGEENIKKSPDSLVTKDHSVVRQPSDVAALASSKLVNQNALKKKTNQEPATIAGTNPMDMLLAKLSEQQAALDQQSEAIKNSDDKMYTRGFDQPPSASTSVPITPATDSFPSTAPTTRPASATLKENRSNVDELLRLKMELAKAQNKINRLDHELSQTRSIKQEDEIMQPVPSARSGMLGPENAWGPNDDNSSDAGAPSVGGYNRSRGIWGNSRTPFSNSAAAMPASDSQSMAGDWYGGGRGGFNQTYIDPVGPYPVGDSYRGDRMNQDTEMFSRPPSSRRNNRFDNSRWPSPQPYGGSNFGSGYGFAPTPGPFGSMVGGPGVPGSNMSSDMYQGYNQQSMESQLSPHATEFTANSGWKSEAIATEGQTYLPTTEPLNYRRLLDRNVNCNWKYIVDKIVCNNDQQASIFLQQKLKVGTPDQKYEIVEAIVAQAYPLMVNRFGNFLVQRCFEHGTPEQVVKIAEAIRGNTLSLSMDPFGCHVVQKAFDSVPEDYKAIMVHELLRRIPETVIHRYACHVWQKLFELRWSESPPQIMKFVNEALRGMWHEVALGETGSLVVQNIFENCLEEDKRPCIEEVLANIDIVAHGQFGNWCIQHICEHGAPADRSRAIDHVIRYAAEYSTDQYASKVVEKCLKIGGGEFLGRYLDRVCEGRVDRPRIPLVDIASDQYGNYLIQYILTHAGMQHREVVAAHIRKHMVSLRGSKFGSRVGMLCTNPAVATRPGPGVGPGIGRMVGGGPRFASGSSYR